MRSKRHWHKFPQILAGKGNVGNTLCIDLPGIGDNKEKAYPNTVKQAVSIMREEFLAKKEGDIWGIVGVSLGGMIALSWQDQYPKDFKKAFIINSSAANVGFAWERLKPQALATCLKSLKNPNAREREQAILKMVSNQAWKEEEILSEWTEIAEQEGLSTKTALRQILSAATFTAPKKTKIPCLIISSTADNMVSWRSSQKLAKRLESSLILHKSAGHDIAIDDPHWLAETIDRWI